MKHLVSQGSHIQIAKEVGVVENEVGPKLLFLDNQTLMKIVALFGEEAVKVVRVLKVVNELTDNEIADKTQMSIYMVRKALHKLYNHFLVVLRRPRDKEKGWFVYHWRHQLDQFAGFITSMKSCVQERLKTRLRYEVKHEFYTCQTLRRKRYIFEEAIEFLFKCPVCHRPMMHFSYNCFIKVLIRKIEHIKTS